MDWWTPHPLFTDLASNWKETKPVNPKGNQHWIFIGRTDAEAEAPILWPLDSVRFSSIAQLCPTLCDPMDCSLPGSLVHGIFQAWILEWVAIAFSRESSWPGDQTGVPRTADRLFTVWATREGKHKYSCWFTIKELYRTLTFSEVVIKLNNFID